MILGGATTRDAHVRAATNAREHLIVFTPEAERYFWERVRKTDGCWLWVGNIRDDGYGRAWFDKSRYQAHRVSYVLAGGVLPEGLVLDHLCRVRNCVNPAHVDLVENGVNVLRGVGASALNARKSACKWGHPFSEENTLITPAGHRACRPCRRAALGARVRCPICSSVLNYSTLRRHLRRWHPASAETSFADLGVVRGVES